MSQQIPEKTSFFYKCKKFLSAPTGIAFGILCCAVCITGIVYLITTSHILQVGYQIWHAPTMLLLNILPVLLVLLLVFFFSGKLFFSISCTGILFVFLAIVDRVKVSMRQEPLLPTDLTLAKEAAAIVKTFPLSSILLIGVLLLFFLFLLILSFLLSKNPKPRFPLRLAGIVLVIFCAFGANQLWYGSKSLYDGYPTVDNPYFQVNQYNTKGLIYSFLHQLNITKLEAPEGYNAAVFAELEKQPAVSTSGEYPHIIMIMGEAFSDLSENEHLDFTDYRDPLKNFKAICADENAVSGHIVVPNFGGGTSNTEYDVLTGCGTRYLENSLPSYNFIHRDFDGLPNRLKQIGYDTVAIHPGYAWFYNRQNVYPDLGFDTCYFLEDSFDLATQGIGGYINETATMDQIMETLETHIQETNNPLFSFTVTIQNHGPYEKKYGTLPANFSTDVSLSETETDLLTQYFQGVSDADEQIGRLWEYAKNSDEPIVLVYFGDHLPGFSNGMDFFQLLDYPIDVNGTPEEQLAVYETPFFIWQNDSAKALCDITASAEQIALPELISSQFLGATLTELLGMEGLSPLYDLDNTLRKGLPVCAKNIYVDADGNYTEAISAEQQKMIAMLKGWQYYMLFDQKLS